jgi:hypothetical protein
VLRPLRFHKPGHAFFPHIGFQARGIGFAQVHQHQAIESVREIAVDVESQQFPADLQVLAQQHRDALAVAFDLGDPR